MSRPELDRLEHQLGRLLLVGVILSTVTLAIGLGLYLFHTASAAAWLETGLSLLMAIPVTRIAASLVDALRRGDRLLAGSTAIVLLVMLASVVLSWRMAI